MPTHVRLVHKTLLDGRYHVYTSPDVQGFNATGETLAEAQRAAVEILDYLAEREGASRPSYEFAEEADRVAA